METTKMAKEWRVAYMHKGHALGAGSAGWVPSEGTARRIMENLSKGDIYRGTELFIEERDAVPGDELKENGIHGGRTVYSTDRFCYEAARPGDLVEEQVALDAGNCVPPAWHGGGMIQCGEPHAHAFDAESGAHRPTFATFRKIADGVWEYRGNCFRGKTEEPAA